MTMTPVNNQVWDVDFTMEFLALYEQQAVLWDPSHMHHLNRREVHEGWLNVQAGLSVPLSIDELKRKKDSLMATYRSHMRRLKEHNEIEPYDSNWFAFEFIHKFMSGRKETPYVAEYQLIKGGDDEHKDDKSRYDDEQEDGKRGLAHQKLPPQNTKETSRSAVPAAKICAKFKFEEQDESAIFTQLIADKIRRMPNKLQVVVQKKINELIDEAESAEAINAAEEEELGERDSPETVGTVTNPFSQKKEFESLSDYEISHRALKNSEFSRRIRAWT